MKIETRILRASTDTIREAAAALRSGALVAFPTETVYGLGAVALNAEAVARVFAAKGRPAEDPLIVHLATTGDLPRVTRGPLSPHVAALTAKFWPGPLTLVLPRHPTVPASVSAGRDTVAVRVPQHPIAHALLAATNEPIAAPSANRFGHTSPTTAAHVLGDLGGRIEMILDGGSTPIGVESTVLDLSGALPTLLRPGGVSVEAIEACIGPIAIAPRHSPTPGSALAAPGMLERHYAPDSPMWLCIGAGAAARAWLRERALTERAEGRRVGILTYDEDLGVLYDTGAQIESLGSAEEPAMVARLLYAALRRLDASRPDVILARDIGNNGIGRAIRDRLMRAASGQVVWLDGSESV